VGEWSRRIIGVGSWGGESWGGNGDRVEGAKERVDWTLSLDFLVDD